MTDAPFTLTDKRLEIHDDGVQLLLASEALAPMQDWMMSAGVDPNDVALPGFIAVSDWGAVTFDAYVRDERGHCTLNPETGDLQRAVRTVEPMFDPEPWPAALRELVRVTS